MVVNNVSSTSKGARKEELSRKKEVSKVSTESIASSARHDHGDCCEVEETGEVPSCWILNNPKIAMGHTHIKTKAETNTKFKAKTNTKSKAGTHTKANAKTKPTADNNSSTLEPTHKQRVDKLTDKQINDLFNTEPYNKVPENHLLPMQLKRMIARREIFSLDGKATIVKGFEATIPLKPGAQPVQQRIFKQSKKNNKIVEKWVKNSL